MAIAQPSLRDSIFAASTGDVPSSRDTLGFTPYIESVAQLSESVSTRPPLTISIEGEWGSGKSSFLRQLRNRLCGPPRDAFRENVALARAAGVSPRSALWKAFRYWLKRPTSIPIEFNAWRHDKRDAVWAAFALKCAEDLRCSQPPLARAAGWVRLCLSRLDGLKGWAQLSRFAVLLILWVSLLIAVPTVLLLKGSGWTLKQIQNLQAATAGTRNAGDKFLGGADPSAADTAANGHRSGEKPAAKSAESEEAGEPRPGLLELGLWLALHGGALGLWVGLLIIGGSQLAKLGNPLETELDKILKTPGYEARVSFVEQFHKDFKKVVDAYAGESRIYVFIDDLDRCDVPRAAELIQAINLLIDDDPRLVFILGMDRDKVAAGIVAKYSSVLTYLKGADGAQVREASDRLQFGYDFLEKFIQIQFRLPQPRVAGLKTFLGNLGRPLPAAFKPSWTKLLFGTKSPDSAAEQEKSAGLIDTDVDATTKINRRAVEIQLETDSDSVTEVALMVAPVFSNNPRRLKQFLNLFRLTTLICAKLGLFDEVDGKPSLTFQQLGKFVGISMAWPGFVQEVQINRELLASLYEAVESGSAGQRWMSRPRLKYLINYGVVSEQGTPLPAADRYSLKNLDLDSLLQVTSPVARPKATAGRAAQESTSDVDQKVSNVADYAITPEAPIKTEVGPSQAEIPSTVPEHYGSGAFEEMVRLLAAEYDSIRKSMPASEERTTRMTAMVRKARSLAGRMPSEDLPLQLFVRSGSAGERIVALALAQASPKQAYFPLALGGIAHAESAFEQFQALSLARWLFDSLNREQREQLQSALLKQETVQIDQQDSSRWRQREELLTRLGSGSTPEAAAMA
jgi:KAP family P-loop domain